jgi:predicted ATPase
MGADHPAGTEPTGAETAIEPATAGGVLVGRERERAEIAEWFGAAASGTRRIGFVTGEAGIGKTTIVDAVLRDLRRAAGADLRIGRGQCVEQFGGGEPYLPVLEAITMLARGPDRPTVETSLRDHAPEWLLGLMGLLEDGKGEPTASTPEHTLHRLAATLEALAVEIPLVLVLEDLHWSDYSTLDLVSMLAQRRESARLLVVCTLRPAEAIVSNHPVASVKRELMRKGLSREILLAGLSPADVRRYLAVRFGAADLPENLLPLLVDRSEGNPFFLVALVDHLLERRLLTESADGWELREASETLRTAVPDSLRALIEPRLEALTEDERHVLAAGSVAGLEFAADVVARAAPQGSDLADQMVLRFVF